MNMELVEQVTARFRQRFGKEPSHLALAPGRVNLLGEHVDYNDGFVFPVAIDRATVIAFSLAGTDYSTLVAADFGEECRISTKNIKTKVDSSGNGLMEWALYPAGVAWILLQRNLSVLPMDAIYASNVPRGAGLSSSASVEMAFMLAWSRLGGWTLPPMQRALLGQKAENTYVGVNCGIMDQFTCACGEAGNLLVLDCRSLEWQALPIPEEVIIVLADTTMRHRLTIGEYNERRQGCQEAVHILLQYLPGIQALRDVSLEDFNRLCNHLPGSIEKLARHVVEEIERTRLAIPLIRGGKMHEFGKIMEQCHASLRDLYDVSTPELNAMVEIAKTLPGYIGARLTGAGFGGCTVNLVERSSAENFSLHLASGYQAVINMKPEIYICQASDGASLIR